MLDKIIVILQIRYPHLEIEMNITSINLYHNDIHIIRIHHTFVYDVNAQKLHQMAINDPNYFKTLDGILMCYNNY